MKNRTLLLGASVNTGRYSNLAIRKLIAKKNKVVAIGMKEGAVLDVKIEVEKIKFKNIDTVTIYLNPTNQKEYYDYIIGLKPRRIIFNPGTENVEFIQLLKEQNIETEVACTLVLLGTNQY